MSKRYVIGAALDLGLPLGFGVDADALYRREGYAPRTIRGSIGSDYTQLYPSRLAVQHSTENTSWPVSRGLVGRRHLVFNAPAGRLTRGRRLG